MRLLYFQHNNVAVDTAREEHWNGIRR